MCIYTDAVFTQNLENPQEVVEIARTKLGVEVEQEKYDYFYHAKATNVYMAYREETKTSAEYFKIRGIHGRDKATDKFVRYHDDLLFKNAIRSFLRSGETKYLTKYLSVMQKQVEQLIEDGDVKALVKLLTKDDKVNIGGITCNVADIEDVH